MTTFEEKQLFKQLQMKVVELEYSRDALRQIVLEQDVIIQEQRNKLNELSALLATPEWFVKEFGHNAVGLWDNLAAALRRLNDNKPN
ncbi:hypothetical protein M3223_02500 [Paenibacillus pasadenensis]|uniref:hypothetical protein n=1 Tax=Paenibacillus pasadenensis TaxID=217090 RepID=UPI00203EDF97|nr:hypothetical protein [Paenibacillus pasadenensis]MCM3746220.1 hypothetical protein [Paenibacillus pasadenensis]